MICLVHQTNFLLDQQLRALEKAFLAEGGLRERMTRARLEARKNVSVHTPISRNALASGFRNNSKKPDANAYRLI